jgi:hypothetical protein
MPERNLTEADVDAIADALESRFMQRIDEQIGRGIRGWLMKVVMISVVYLLYMAYAKGIKP